MSTASLPQNNSLDNMVRNSDPNTSREAATSFSIERLTDIQRDVYQFFLSQPSFRATDEQVEDALKLKYPAQTTARKRRTDLTRYLVLRDSGSRDKSRNNRSIIVWEITPEYRPN